jgi:hypothetical protein
MEENYNNCLSIDNMQSTVSSMGTFQGEFCMHGGKKSQSCRLRPYGIWGLTMLSLNVPLIGYLRQSAVALLGN